MKQKLLIALVAAIILAGAVYLYTSRKAEAPEQNNTNTQTNAPTNSGGDLVPGDPVTNTVDNSKDSIAVSTQLMGESVTIDNAVLTDAGYIVIHTIDAAGKIGAVVGTSNYLSAGPKQDLEIKATIQAGGKYMAEIHKDDGDKKFDMTKDLAVKINNLPVMAMFSVSQ